MRTVLFASILLFATFAIAPASASCGVISRSAAVPTEGATANVVLVQCQDSYADEFYSYTAYSNDTAVYVSDPTTGLSVQAHDHSDYTANKMGDYGWTDAGHSYSVFAGGQGVYLASSVSVFQETQPTSCYGFGSVGAYQSSPAQGTSASETVPLGGQSPVSCVPQDDLNLLP